MSDCRIARFGLCFCFPVFFYFYIDSLLQWIPNGIYKEHGNHAIMKGTKMDFQTIDNILGIIGLTLVTISIVTTAYGVISIIRSERGAN